MRVDFASVTLSFLTVFLCDASLSRPKETNSNLDSQPIRNHNSRLSVAPMRSAIRKTRSFSLDQNVLSEVERTKGSNSASERVNQLLKYGLEMERKASLYQEAAQFFRGASEDRQERRAFQRAGFKSWARK